MADLRLPIEILLLYVNMEGSDKTAQSFHTCIFVFLYNMFRVCCHGCCHGNN